MRRKLFFPLCLLLCLLLCACGPAPEAPTAQPTVSEEVLTAAPTAAKPEPTAASTTAAPPTTLPPEPASTAAPTAQPTTAPATTAKTTAATTIPPQTTAPASTRAPTTTAATTRAAAATTAKQTTVPTTAKPTAAPTTQPPQTLSCTLSIDCKTLLSHLDELDDAKRALVPANGVLLAARTVSFEEGETVFDVLKRTCRQNGIQMEFSMTPVYRSVYIEGIGNLYEFDGGPLSGWMYSVNGVFPNVGCSGCDLHDGDVIAWRYTCELGGDIGGHNQFQ
ncbi:MAG: DUF4430 domain-containing protein [Clostridia bacterium]|nr:DUF4430 domain-containing protein [Clostridia bacterium]